MEIIARVYTDFPEKFGIPRQSGLVDALEARVVFRERLPRARGAARSGGLFPYMADLAVFAGRARKVVAHGAPAAAWAAMCAWACSPRARPSAPIPSAFPACGWRASTTAAKDGPRPARARIRISINGTPVYDIKPYLPFVDSHPEATGGFAGPAREHALRVEFPETLLQAVPERAREALKALLAQDPRPSYQHDPERLYGLPFAGVDVRFTVDGDTLTVREVGEYRPEHSASETA